MSMKSIIIGIVVILILAAGGYFVYQNYLGAPGQNSTPATDTVQAQDTVVGTGAQAAPGSIVSVLYTGMLQDGTVFDSSETHGNEPLVFQLGAPGIIAGFQIGVNGMNVGGERRMVVPSALGYGGEDIKDPASGAVVIPANSTLVFDVKLVKVEAAPATPTPVQ